MADNLKLLWGDAGLQEVWSQRSSFQVLDSLEHYMKPENLDRICESNYIPTEQDILHARVRTSGIVEERYEIDGVNFTMFDVGGQRNERKKWIHAFDGVTAVIFVAALNEYDLVLYEDNKTARIAEAVKLFDEIANSQWFAKTSIILFLNKVDLFVAKLLRVPYRVDGSRNDDFEGPFVGDEGVSTEEAILAAQKHTLDKFLSVKRDDSKEIYHHITCATDTKNVEVVFNACKDIILRSNLVESGFMQ
jgi:tRNA U34 5-carboxymethylaminomethyl modifying GTPase MnmE/TrmE